MTQANNKSLKDLSDLLKNNHQEHLFEALSLCPEHQQSALIEKLKNVNWSELNHYATPPDLNSISSSPVIDSQTRLKKEAELNRLGEAAYRTGQVAALIVAGGQGTRLGYEGPKGCFPISPLSKKPLYQVHIEKVLAANSYYGSTMPLVIMTSPATDAETHSFLQEHSNFGLADHDLLIFSQGTVPTISTEGKALLADEANLLENPDGHGGCYQALLESGTIDTLKARGIAYLIYIQVDNVLAPVDDPILIGLMLQEKAEMATKVLEKVAPTEKVGNLVRLSGKDCIVEYTELTPEQSEIRDNSGQFIFRWGSPAMHAFSISFFKRLEQESCSLPFHRSQKPVQAWIDGQIQEVQAWKNEKFIFDLIPLAQRHVSLAIERADEFAPVKNASGTDSPDSAIELLSKRNQRWLQKLNIDCSQAGILEIDNLFASSFAQLESKKDSLPKAISSDTLIK